MVFYDVGPPRIFCCRLLTRAPAPDRDATLMTRDAVQGCISSPMNPALPRVIVMALPDPGSRRGSPGRPAASAGWHMGAEQFIYYHIVSGMHMHYVYCISHVPQYGYKYGVRRAKPSVCTAAKLLRVRACTCNYCLVLINTCTRLPVQHQRLHVPHAMISPRDGQPHMGATTQEDENPSFSCCIL